MAIIRPDIKIASYSGIDQLPGKIEVKKQGVIEEIAIAILKGIGLLIAGIMTGGAVGGLLPFEGKAIGAPLGGFAGLILSIILIVQKWRSDNESKALIEEGKKLQSESVKNAQDLTSPGNESITLPKVLDLISRIDAFQTKFGKLELLDNKEIKALHESLLDSVQEQAIKEFNLLCHKVVAFTIEEGNSANIEKGKSLISEINRFEEKFGCRSPDGKLTGPVFAKAAKVGFRIEKRDIENLKNKVFLIIQRKVPSFDLITNAISFDDQPVTADEKWFSQKFVKKFPNLWSKNFLSNFEKKELDVSGNQGIVQFNGENIEYTRTPGIPINSSSLPHNLQ